jgi:uncharacterized protein
MGFFMRCRRPRLRSRDSNSEREIMCERMISHAEGLRRKLLQDGSLVLEVKVIPRAHTGQVVEVMANGALKVKVRAAPEKGKANEELCRVLAEYLSVSRRSVEVILGQTSQQKRVKVVV